MNKYRTHTCCELSEKEIGKTVHLSGWLHRKRDHGNLLFIDLRDHYGITQCVIENNNNFFPVLEKTRPESVIKISGNVVKRSSGTENLELKTGKIEVSIESLIRRANVLLAQGVLDPGHSYLLLTTYYIAT